MLSTRSNSSSNRLNVTKFLFLFGIALLVSCSGTQDSEGPEIRPGEGPVVSVNYPLHYFATEISGGNVEVEYLIRGDFDPELWIPGEQSLQKIQSASLILLNGEHYAPWTKTVSLPESRVVDTLVDLEDRLIELEADSVHRHGPEGQDHGATSYAYTTWLNPDYAIIQVNAIKDAFIKRWPQHKEAFDTNAQVLIDNFLRKSDSLRQISADFPQLKVIASRPVYQYLAATADWDLEVIEFDTRSFPPEEQWQALEALLETHPAKLMIWHEAPISDARGKLLEMGIHSTVFSTVNQQPEVGDYRNVFGNNWRDLNNALRKIAADDAKTDDVSDDGDIESNETENNRTVDTTDDPSDAGRQKSI